MHQLLTFLNPVMVYSLILTFVLTIVLTKVLIHYAPKLGLIDIPNNRSVHKKLIPRGAGIAMIISMIISNILFWEDFVVTHLWTLLSILMVFFIGLLDDHKDAPPKAKFFVITLAVIILYFDGVTINSLGSVCGQMLYLGWFALPFTIFAVAGFTNALNLSDGLDGLAGSLSIVIFGALSLIGAIHNDTFIVIIALSTIVAIFGFLIFNWHPAKIFMGDSGSLTLGFIISILAIKSLAYIDPSTILFIASIRQARLHLQSVAPKP
jgi:UDP-GlcNAc:undecaprenyl-phosphate GlcNAc-1-phosphate transferase